MNTRMKRYFLPLALLLLVPMLHGASKGFFWEVKSDHTTVYLLGSVHVAKEDFYPMQSKIENAFEASDSLVVEADLDSANQGSIQQEMSKMATYPYGESIKDHLSYETLSLLRKRLTEYGSNLAAVQMYKPWMVSMTIQMQEIAKAGFTAEHGIDLYFMNKARRTGKGIIELEGLLYQIKLFNSFPDSLQELSLLDALTTQTEIYQNIDRVGQAWKDGDTQIIQDLFLKDINDPKMKPLYETVLYGRHPGMIEKIERFLNSNKTYFVVVGVGHMIGERGLVEMLQDRGYQVKRM